MNTNGSFNLEDREERNQRIKEIRNIRRTIKHSVSQYLNTNGEREYMRRRLPFSKSLLELTDDELELIKCAVIYAVQEAKRCGILHRKAFQDALILQIKKWCIPGFMLSQMYLKEIQQLRAERYQLRRQLKIRKIDF